jgi:hypothetical protein
VGLKCVQQTEGFMTLTKQQWQARTAEAIRATASKRRQLNAQRRRAAAQRCEAEVWPRLLAYGFDAPGVCARISREIGCHRSTACRMRQRILREMLE